MLRRHGTEGFKVASTRDSRMFIIMANEDDIFLRTMDLRKNAVQDRFFDVFGNLDSE